MKELRESLKALGNDLFVAHEKPEVFLKKLIAPGMVNTIVYQAEISKDQRTIEDEVKK